MTTENESPETSEIDDSKQNERRRSTTVIMTMNVTMPAEGETNGLRRNGSMRRRLSKQNATIEEPISLLSISDPSESSDKTVPCIEEHPEEGKEDSGEKPPIERSDGHKLRLPGLAQKKTWSTSKSLSRESNGTEYSDRSGTDLRTFVDRTLHKSEEDRKQLLEFEQELKNLILDESVQSKKFELPSSYHRMLLHRVAAWFGLDHNVTNKQTDIVVNKSERTKMPDECFTDFIRHNNYVEDGFKRQNTGGSRKELHHMESFGDQTSQYGSQASLNHDLLMMRRAQSFDVAPVTGPSVMQSPQPTQHVRGLPMRQLSLNCPQQQIVGSPNSGAHGHQWAPQRSFDCSNNSYLCTGKHPIMRKAESFGGMTNGITHGCYESNVQMVCQTPPSVMVHHHHHHSHVQQPTSNYTGYQVFDEMPMGSPNYPPVSEPGMCSPGGTYYEYVPQVVQPQQYARPIRYMSHDYNQRRPPSAGMQYMYGPPQYVQYQPIVHPEVEVIVDPVQTQPFPPVTHFVVPPADQQQGYASCHQAETANSFIKASIDGGYGSMNQETESSGNAEKVEEISQ
ncbi:hypothetical protein CRE_04773 [Caenorhabditis remanei]|uniref:R3H domain-containing protein n=1 Tax=Caenorhabditis remanei TaxID=31234 RepID=E3LZ67_CAERE|nr:hypothetical protein CRE_04773 [Caenorhabditis remanei]